MKTRLFILSSILAGPLLHSESNSTKNPPSLPEFGNLPVVYRNIGDTPASYTKKEQPAETPAQKFDLNDLIGEALIDANGNPVDPATLKDKFIGIYFSASWCGPCRKFTPKLVEFRNQIPDEFEVVFASADHDSSAMLAYMKEAGMPWPALPFGSPQISALNRTFQVQSIPTFVVLDPTGRLASPNARNDVSTLSPKDALAKWKTDAENPSPAKVSYHAPQIFPQSTAPAPTDTILDPGKSLLGCPIGSTQDEVVERLGKPMGIFKLGENKTALLYFNSTALMCFMNGKLEDGKFSNYSQLNRDYYDRFAKIAYSFPNGITLGISLQKAKDILGDQLTLNKGGSCYSPSFIENGYLVKLSCSRKSNIKNPDDLNAYTIYSIEIEKQKTPVAIQRIDPAKSIFKCPLGATEVEVIDILGEPEGKIDLGSNKLGLFYHNYHSLLIFWDGALGGGVFTTFPVLENASRLSPKCEFTLTNGLALGTTLEKAKEILGDKLDTSKQLNQFSYKDGDSLVTIDSSCWTPSGVSYEQAKKYLKYYKINEISINPISKAQPAPQTNIAATPAKKTFPTRQNSEAFNPAEMVTVEGGTLSEKSNLPGVEVDSFSIGKYEVTNAEWLAIQAFAQLNGYSFSKEPRTDHPELPIEGVSRQEAMLWCNAKSEKEGLQPVYWLEGIIYKSPNGEPEMNLDANGYRLPTEPEWEWAARGGLKSKGYQFSGSDNMDEVAWHGEKGEKWAWPVGIKKANELGIHDMAGNACEWVWDTNIPTYGVMGGCYMSSRVGTNLKYREAGPFRKFVKEVGRARSLGFRVARNLSAESTPRLTPVSFQLKAEESDPKAEPPPTQKVDLLGLVKKELVNAEGKPVDSATLDGKMIALYFSAQWCGPCKAFTPKLVEFANKAKDDVAVVFVSSDRDQSAMFSYMKDAGMPWPAIPFGSENALQLKRELHVSGIPALVVLNANGDVIAPRGRNDVDSLPPEACIQKWKNSEPQDPSELAYYDVPPLFQRPAPPRPKNITLDPGKSIFGCAYGSSESDVINTLGQPLGRSEYGDGITELIYGNDCALVFHNDRLSGASLIRNSTHSFLDSFSYSSPKNYFPNTYSGGWKLSNGIHPMMTTRDASKIIGNDIFKNHPHQITLNGQTIEFPAAGSIIHSLNIFSKDVNKISRRILNSPNFEFLPTNPKEHIFGCKLGSDSKKIIETFGKPTTIFYFGDKKEGYLYNQDLLILFDEKLVGAQLNSTPLTLTNGIQIGMPLSEAIAFVGENKIKKKWDNFSTISYLDGSSIVTLNSIDKDHFVDWSAAKERKKDPKNLKISSIYIDPKAYDSKN